MTMRAGRRIFTEPVSFEQLRRFPDEGRRHELIDGQVLVSVTPGAVHQRCLAELTGALVGAVPPHLRVVVGPVGWLVSETTFFQPDLAVVSGPPGDVGYLTAPPLLVVEVLSPETQLREEGFKLAAYGSAGLPWHWAVDPVEPRLTVRRLVDGHYRNAHTVTVRGDERYEGDEPFPVALTPARVVD